MATNPQLFLDGKHWCGVHDAVTPEEIIRVASMTSVSSNPCLALAFQEEVMAVRKRSSLTGLWELFAAFLATGCSIQSVHPPMGCPLYRLHCNRIVRAPGVSQDHKLFIMWKTNHDDGAVGGKLDPKPLCSTCDPDTTPLDSETSLFTKFYGVGKPTLVKCFKKTSCWSLCVLVFW